MANISSNPTLHFVTLSTSIFFWQKDITCQMTPPETVHISDSLCQKGAKIQSKVDYHKKCCPFDDSFAPMHTPGQNQKKCFNRFPDKWKISNT